MQLKKLEARIDGDLRPFDAGGGRGDECRQKPGTGLAYGLRQGVPGAWHAHRSTP